MNTPTVDDLVANRELLDRYVLENWQTLLDSDAIKRAIQSEKDKLIARELKELRR